MGFSLWIVSDWHTVLHVRPPLVDTSELSGVGGFSDFSLSWIDASFDGVVLSGKITPDFDSIGFATLVRINPVETIVQRFAIFTTWSTDIIDFTGKYFQSTEYAVGISFDHVDVVHGLVTLWTLVVGLRSEHHSWSWTWWAGWTWWTWVTTWTWHTHFTGFTAGTSSTGLTSWTWWTDGTDKTASTSVTTWTLTTSWTWVTSFTSRTWSTG